jgi:hypothetical protein
MLLQIIFISTFGVCEVAQTVQLWTRIPAQWYSLATMPQSSTLRALSLLHIG